MLECSTEPFDSASSLNSPSRGVLLPTTQASAPSPPGQRSGAGKLAIKCSFQNRHPKCRSQTGRGSKGARLFGGSVIRPVEPETPWRACSLLPFSSMRGKWEPWPKGRTGFPSGLLAGWEAEIAILWPEEVQEEREASSCKRRAGRSPAKGPQDVVLQNGRPNAGSKSRTRVQKKVPRRESFRLVSL